MNQDFLESLQEICEVKQDEPMKRHTTFRIGGPADFYIAPTSIADLAMAIRLCREYAVPYAVIGNGSDLLVSDQGYRGLIIQLYKNWSGIRVDGVEITAQSGALLSTISARALEASLSGMEQISGIPGTLGGACVMNAGAYGAEIKDILTEVLVLDQEGQIKRFHAQELEFGYRTSVIKKKNYIVLEAKMSLKTGNREEIAALMKEYKDRRNEKQPLDLPSAGSTFKRPEGYFAGKLIMDAGLRGYRVGDAAVSEKHCGFVVNLGNATAADVLQLITDVKDRVREQFAVELEPEVKFLGEF